ncbi:MAG: FadR/GntR family transcriptional regulator [Thermoleophilia bacterium]
MTNDRIPPADGGEGGHIALNAAPLAGLRRLSAFDTVRVRIGLAVDLGLLAPGERLPSSKDIAEALEVGEITVRRALVSLCEDGVLVRRRGRDGGTLVAENPARGVVREISAYESAVGEVGRLIDQRLLLECGVAHLAALKAGETDMADLEHLIAELDASVSWADFHRADERFHLRLAESTGVASATEELRHVLHSLYRYYLPYPIDYLRGSNAEHKQLISAMRRRDVGAAVKVVHDHVDELHRTMFVGLLARSEGTRAGKG